MFCIHCGTQLPDTSRFCSSCGTPVGAVVPPISTKVTLTIDRESQAFLINPTIKILIGNDVRLAVANGETKIVDLPIGIHKIICTMGMTKKELTVDLTSNTVISIRYNRISGGIDANVL